MKAYATSIRIPQDPGLPQLELALDPDRILPLLQLPEFAAPPQNCSVQYLRYKPGTNCIVLYKIQLPEGQQTWAYGKLTSNGRESRPSDEIRLSHYYPDHKLSLCVFPRDLQIPSLSLLAHPLRSELLKGVVSSGKRSRFEAHVDAWTPIRYKPERRCVMRGSYQTKAIGQPEARDNKDFYAKFYAEPIDRLAGWHRYFSRLNRPGFLVAPLLGYGRRRRLLLLREVQGVPLINSCLESGVGDDGSVTVLARALAAFHRLDPPLGAAPLQLTSVLAQSAETLQRLLPECTVSPVDIAEELTGTMPRENPNRLLHGDFYHDQILIRKRKSAVLLDLDRLTIGDPAFDLANFCAQLRFLSLRGGISAPDARRISERFVESYLQESGEASIRRLRWYFGASLFLLALWPFRHFDRDWPELTGRLIREAAEELRGQTW